MTPVKLDHQALWEEFYELNQSKRWVQRALSPEELKRWKRLRMEIEKIVGRGIVYPSRDCREAIRLPAELMVYYRVGGQQQQKVITTLGEGGCFIACHDPLPKGTELVLDISLPRTAERFTLRGKVVWTSNRTRNPGIGIQFTSLKPEQKATLYQFIDTQIKAGLGLE